MARQCRIHASCAGFQYKNHGLSLRRHAGTRRIPGVLSSAGEALPACLSAADCAAVERAAGVLVHSSSACHPALLYGPARLRSTVDARACVGPGSRGRAGRRAISGSVIANLPALVSDSSFLPFAMRYQPLVCRASQHGSGSGCVMRQVRAAQQVQVEIDKPIGLNFKKSSAKGGGLVVTVRPIWSPTFADACPWRGPS